jgi:hypothetical protein
MLVAFQLGTPEFSTPRVCCGVCSGSKPLVCSFNGTPRFILIEDGHFLACPEDRALHAGAVPGVTLQIEVINI